MKNTITYAQALEMAIKVCSVPANEDKYADVVEKLSTLREKYLKTNSISDEAKAARSAKQKAATAAARAELVAKVAPVLRKHLTADITAKELYEVAKDELPDGFSAAKVQNILLREMKSELVRSENGRNASTYHLI